MSFLEKLKASEKSFPLTFIGTTITALAFAFAVYVFFYKDRPELTYELLSQANLLDIQKPLSELQISFQEKDLVKEKLNIRIYVLRIANTGNLDILQTFFDGSIPWGIEIQNGEVIEVRFVESNSDYIKENMTFKLVDNNNIIFNKRIIEKGVFFSLEFLVLHNQVRNPQIIPTGKIAGIGEISIQEGEQQAREGFWSYIIQQSLVFKTGVPILILLVSGGVWIAILYLRFEFIPSFLRQRRHRKIRNYYGHTFKYTKQYYGGHAVGSPILARFLHEWPNNENDNYIKSQIATLYCSEGKRGLKSFLKELNEVSDTMLQDLSQLSKLLDQRKAIKAQIQDQINSLAIKIVEGVELKDAKSQIEKVEEEDNAEINKLRKQVSGIEEAIREEEATINDKYPQLLYRGGRPEQLVPLLIKVEIAEFKVGLLKVTDEFLNTIKLFANYIGTKN